MYTLYILRCADDSFYTGITTNLEKRLQQHNTPKGVGSKYVRSRLPFTVHYLEKNIPDRSTATKRELAVKALPRAKKEKLGIAFSL